MFNFKKKFGQNFVCNKKIINKIISHIDLSNYDVLEIGTGMGSLTFPISFLCKKVTSYEIDKELKEYLQNQVKDYKNIEIVFNDFFKEEKKIDENTVLVSNPPYNLSSKVLFYYLNSDIKKAILMFQKELVDRLLASPKTKDYNALSVIFQAFCDMERVTNVLKKDFTPSPKVDSAVIYLIKKEIKTDEEYILFIREIFSQKRKTILNNLKNSKYYNKEKIEGYLLDNYQNSKLRAEQMTESEIKQLFNYLK